MNLLPIANHSKNLVVATLSGIGGEYGFVGAMVDKYLNFEKKIKSYPSFYNIPTPTIDRLFGRKDDLDNIKSAFRDKNISIYSLISGGGFGKSSLIYQFINEMALSNYYGVDFVFGWSFYSQGTHQTYTTSTLFFDKALEKIGFSGELPTTDDGKANLLAKLIYEKRVLLILDGIEPLQFPQNIQNGRVRDVALRTFLTQIARNSRDNKNSLILISSRQPIVELKSFSTYKECKLEKLSVKAGKELLLHLGVRYKTHNLFTTEIKEPFYETVEEYGGNPLALVLLGKLLVKKFDRDILRRFEISKDSNLNYDNQADRILKYYATIWKKDKEIMVFLFLLSLYDRPAPIIEIKKLVQSLPFTKTLKNISEDNFKNIIVELKRFSLISSVTNRLIDMHPIVRDYFNKIFKTKHNQKFELANRKLFSYLKRKVKIKNGDNPSFEKLQPLIRAVYHGCLAREYKVSLDDIYYFQIMQADRYYLRDILGAYTTNLFILSQFFIANFESVVVDKNIDEHDKTWLISETSFTFQALGDIEKSTQINFQNIKDFVKLGEYDNICTIYENLTDNLIFMGELEKVQRVANKSLLWTKKAQKVKVDSKEEFDFKRIIAETKKAYIYYLIGKYELAKEKFEYAEKLQYELDKKRFLASINGYYYISFLLENHQNKLIYENCLERAEYNYDIGFRHKWLTDMGLAMINKAKTYRYLKEYKKALECISEAEQKLTEGHRFDFLTEALIEKAIILNLNHIDVASREIIEDICELSKLNNLKLQECRCLYAMANMSYYSKSKKDKFLKELKELASEIGFFYDRI